MGFPEAPPKNVHWSTLTLEGNSTGRSSCSIRVSNPNLQIPKGLEVYTDFVTSEECSDILTDHERGNPIWEGFEQRRKVQRWSRDDPDLPDSLKLITTRFEERTGNRPLQVSLEEYPTSQLQKYFNHLPTLVTTFESAPHCSNDDDDDDDEEEENQCFSSIIPIASSVAEIINRPKERRVDCWNLFSDENHSSGVVLDRRSLYLKTEECFWEWRSRITSVVDSDMEKEELDENIRGRYILLKFTRLPVTTSSGGDIREETKKESDCFGYVADPESMYRPVHEMPSSLEELLTIIVTTSPIQSHPSTELLERVFDTFQYGGKEFALKCRKVIVCDGCRCGNVGGGGGGENQNQVSKKHATAKQSMRNGIVNTQQLENYNAFKVALRNLCETAPPDSPFHTAMVEELEERHGYGFALRHAVRECIETPYVIVIQHDRTFMRTCPIYDILRTMWRYRNIKYVGMNMRSNLVYRDIFLAKYGKAFSDEMAACTLRPPELALDANQYGPDSSSTRSMKYRNEKMRENFASLAENYALSHQNLEYVAWKQANTIPPEKWQLSLTPTFFWYDNTHICETAHYRDFIFNPRYKMVARGGFVEDKLSPVIKKTVERLGLTEGHARFGCYLLDDHSGMFFTGHLDGGGFLTESQREEAISAHRIATHDK